jgi:hypothetical protein
VGGFASGSSAVILVVVVAAIGSAFALEPELSRFSLIKEM